MYRIILYGNQRTKEWSSKVVKVKKKYEYMPMLLARIMGLRNEDHGAVARQVSLNASDPALIAANIAEKPSPPSKELYQSPKSRFTKSGEVEKSVRLYYNQFCAVFWIR